MIRQFISTRGTTRSRIDVDVAAQVRLIKESWIWIVFLSRTAPPEGRYGSINELSEWSMRSPGFVGRRKARLLVNGNDAFMEAVVDRILRKHSKHIYLNHCPRCGARAKRTARQCPK